jgi:NADH:ubiquinone oxidoreductase subunit
VQFLNPIWLFAIAAISIPVVIHLWNIRRGKTLKVGSIALVTAAAQKSSRSFKLNEVLLFILRCLFLLILAFLLATPFLRRNHATAKTKGWVLIPKANLKETCKNLKFIVDSLAKIGYEFHFFDEGFKSFELNKVLNDSLLKDKPEVKNYWNLVAKLNEKLPSNIPVYLLTPNQAKYFNGNKPSVSLNLHWLTYTAADSVATWIESAWFTGNNSIKVIKGNSGPSGTYFTNYVIQSDGDPKSPFIVNVNHGRPVISLKTAPEKHTPIDTGTLRIAIYSDKYSVDEKYLGAALQTIIDFTQRKIIVKKYADAAQIPAKQDWLFWLSDKPVDANMLNKAAHVLNYQSGKVSTEFSAIKTKGSFTLSGDSEVPAIYKLVKNEAINGQAIWVDGYGNPVLTQEQSPQTTRYHFYSHFNPAWNDLVWSDSFPKLLLRLVLYGSDNELIKSNDLTKVDHRQMMPNIIWSAKKVDNNKVNEQTDLSHYFWLMLIAVFIAERWLAHKNKLVLKHD